MRTSFAFETSQPWLILPDSLNEVLSVADHPGNLEALESRLGQKLPGTNQVSIRNGVAVVPVTGPILRYSSWITRILGGTTTDVLATDIRSALDNPAVKAIVLNIDSPGGAASGINELADMIHAGRSKKRIVSYIGGTGASAAYWIASAASQIVVDETALVGSIGVVLDVVTGERAGEKRYTITSRNAPNKRPDMDTEHGRAKVAETIDALADVFVKRVARNLGMSTDKVVKAGDSGGMRVGAAAVKAGLAHKVGSLESLIASLSAGSAQSGSTSHAQTVVYDTQGLRRAISEGVPASSITISCPTQSAKLAAVNDGARHERARCIAIRELAPATAAGWFLVTAAIRDGISPDQFSERLAAARLSTKDIWANRRSRTH